MTRQIIHTGQAPAAVGPYSQAVRVGNLVYTAGQIGLDPATGKLQAGLEAQTRQVMANLRAVLEAAGASLGSVVKTTIFLTDMGDFAAVNAIYGEFFPDAPPARSTVAVAALPLGALVEIEVVALAEA
ncbi:MAG TPA: RidA family protein [Anaerolineae bacterium]|nr:RidA family protein [Anaerolineae bacterium]